MANRRPSQLVAHLKIWTLKPNSSSRSSELLLYSCHSSSPKFFWVAQSQEFKLLCINILVAKVGKSNNKRSDVSLGLRRLNYISCSMNRFFINISNILNRLLQQWYKSSPHLNLVKVHSRMRLASCAKVVQIGNHVLVASGATRAALPSLLW